MTMGYCAAHGSWMGMDRCPACAAEEANTLRLERDAALAAARKCGEEMATMQARAEKAEKERDEWRRSADHRYSMHSGKWFEEHERLKARVAELERDLAAARAEVERLMTLASDLRLSRDRLFNRQEALRARCEALEKALRHIRDTSSEPHEPQEAACTPGFECSHCVATRALLAAPAPERKD